MKLRIHLLSLLLAIPFLGVAYQAEDADLKSALVYANNDLRPVANFAFVDQDIPENSGGQTFLSKHIPKFINTNGRIFLHNIDGIFNNVLQNEFTRGTPRPLTTSYYLIDRFLRSSISPNAP